MKVTLRIWRQANAQAKGQMVTYPLDGVSEDMSFLEMLDLLNEKFSERLSSSYVTPYLYRYHSSN